jgi:hypothetical protein
MENQGGSREETSPILIHLLTLVPFVALMTRTFVEPLAFQILQINGDVSRIWKIFHPGFYYKWKQGDMRTKCVVPWEYTNVEHDAAILAYNVLDSNHYCRNPGNIQRHSGQYLLFQSQECQARRPLPSHSRS